MVPCRYCITGMFVSLAVTDRSEQQQPGAPVSFSIPVSWAELKVIQTISEFCIPRFLGFDKMLS
jgi:hypothetical protein